MFDNLTLNVMGIVMFFFFMVYTICMPFAEIYVLTVSNSTALNTYNCFNIWDNLICSIISHILVVAYVISASALLFKGFTDKVKNILIIVMCALAVYVLTVRLWTMVALVNGIVQYGPDCPEMRSNSYIFDTTIVEGAVFLMGIFMVLTFVILVVLVRKTNCMMDCCTSCDDCWRKTLSISFNPNLYRRNSVGSDNSTSNLSAKYQVDLDRSNSGGSDDGNNSTSVTNNTESKQNISTTVMVELVNKDKLRDHSVVLIEDSDDEASV